MRLLSTLAPHDSQQRRRNRLIRRAYHNKVFHIPFATSIICIVKTYMQGPNYLWHIDGLDKLKQFGFAIHGCIDGLVIMLYAIKLEYLYINTCMNCECFSYSRRVLWLKVGTSNNDPEVVAYHYLKAVEEIGEFAQISVHIHGSHVYKS